MTKEQFKLGLELLVGYALVFVILFIILGCNSQPENLTDCQRDCQKTSDYLGTTYEPYCHCE